MLEGILAKLSLICPQLTLTLTSATGMSPLSWLLLSMATFPLLSSSAFSSSTPSSLGVADSMTIAGDVSEPLSVESAVASASEAGTGVEPVRASASGAGRGVESVVASTSEAGRGVESVVVSASGAGRGVESVVVSPSGAGRGLTESSSVVLVSVVSRGRAVGSIATCTSGVAVVA